MPADRHAAAAAALLTDLSLRPGAALAVSEAHLSLQLAYGRWVAVQARRREVPVPLQALRAASRELARAVENVRFALLAEPAREAA